MSPDVVLTALKVFAGILFWWRVVKVVVLHGSPIPWGLTLASGRESGGVSGRLGHMASIEDGGETWFGAVMWTPASPKLYPPLWRLDAAAALNHVAADQADVVDLNTREARRFKDE